MTALDANIKKEMVRKRIQILMILCQKHGRKCWYCGLPFKSFKEVEVDHIVPTSRGGSKQLHNLALACKLCNKAKWDLKLDEFLHWLKRPKSTMLHVQEIAKIPESQWLDFGKEIEKGLRTPTKRGKTSKRRNWRPSETPF